MRRKRGGRKKCIRLTICLQKGALMKFYDVALPQGVHDKVLTYDFFRFVSGAHEHFFKGQQKFEYQFRIGGLASDMGWMMTSGNVTGKKDEKDFAFPLNISLTVAKDSGPWLVAAIHFSTLTGGADAGTKGTQ